MLAFMRSTLLFLCFLVLFGTQAEALEIIRGPYLQMATQSTIIIRWRTNEPTSGIVNVGYEPHQLNMPFHASTEKKIDHEVQITGLTEGTQYFYEVLSTNEQGQKVQSERTFFETLPIKGAKDLYTFLVLGDAGTGKPEQFEAKKAALAYNKSEHFDGVLILGDNAYPGGSDQNFQDNFFHYDEIFSNSVIWPTPGNHDYNNHIPFSGKPAYYDIFNCPTNAEAGGVASASERYYSYDYGNIHFVSLDSYDESSKPQKKMVQWLEADLKANNQEWTVVYFHHPPYSKGSHNSDNPNGIDRELVKMRTRIVPVLEKYKVDLVLNGHSHSYERSFLLKGHYGKSKSITDSNFVDSTRGSFPSTCPYHKNAKNGGEGTIYCVMGCSGKRDHVKKPKKHVVMCESDFTKVGVLLLTINGNQLTSNFLTTEGKVFDTFTIVKNAGKVEEVVVTDHQLPDLQTSWNEMRIWTENGIEVKELPHYVHENMIIKASDRGNCIEDVFKVTLK